MTASRSIRVAANVECQGLVDSNAASLLFPFLSGDLLSLLLTVHVTKRGSPSVQPNGTKNSLPFPLGCVSGGENICLAKCVSGSIPGPSNEEWRGMGFKAWRLVGWTDTPDSFCCTFALD